MIFIENNNLDPALNHAIELYVMDKYDEDIFMLWRNRPCILIGRYQNIYMEVNLDFTSANNMDVIRRFSGGGAIYCDTDNMQYTFITKDKIEDSFKTFAKPVVNALKSLGLNAEFTGRNDIQINGAKVSGNAQFHRNGKVVHHGTLLFKANMHNLTNALKPRDIKFKGKAVKSVSSRIGFISEFINMNVEEFKAYVEEFIRKEYGITNITRLSPDDMVEIQKIKEEIFDTDSWNFGSGSLKKNRNTEKYPCGIVEIGLEAEDGKIKELTIEGDFFSELGVDNLCNILKGTVCSVEAVTEALQNVDFSKYIKSMSKEDFINDLVKLFEKKYLPVNRKKREFAKKPAWLQLRVQGDQNTAGVKKLVQSLNLHTVCHEANCPNRMECFARKTAKFMILGRNCTRNCTFCNVTRNKPDPLDLSEPENVAKAVKTLQLKHAVVTSVTRDDLQDQGANQFAEVVKQIRKYNPEATIELLIPDMSGREDLLNIILETKPDILNHNVETIPAFYPKVRPAADFMRSIKVLDYSKKYGVKTKSGIMVGFGETEAQVVDVFRELRKVDCDMLTVGQYLQPTKRHIPVTEYVTPQQFSKYKSIALDMGFKKVNSGPLVRSSYHAEAI